MGQSEKHFYNLHVSSKNKHKVPLSYSERKLK